MSQVLFQMIQKGTVFDIIKVKGKFFDCGTPDGLEAAKGYVTVGTL
jgi:UTP-glucose-1-phosphate uridylyltransferase